MVIFDLHSRSLLYFERSSSVNLFIFINLSRSNLKYVELFFLNFVEIILTICYNTIHQYTLQIKQEYDVWHVTLAGQQRDIDLLDHLDPVQHLGQRLAAERLRGVPDGRVGHAGALRLQVEHVVASAHRLGAVGRVQTTACVVVELQAEAEPVMIRFKFVGCLDLCQS